MIFKSFILRVINGILDFRLLDFVFLFRIFYYYLDREVLFELKKEFLGRY